ncbi:hypothetical protein CAOG_007936 [Capsaspora owczarzaki ATCC 30864]|uniref:S1 motif domain-containing protein n=1 Tax=Capsaspora owczarzaki (strain ATCC 30864) TaxID=595528 RepID=A0A0D2X5I2_CAPO3|nr:hypothetical protein CAOG_007936 [Capsaspora owczarzaki ATCC 30864]
MVTKKPSRDNAPPAAANSSSSSSAGKPAHAAAAAPSAPAALDDSAAAAAAAVANKKKKPSQAAKPAAAVAAAKIAQPDEEDSAPPKPAAGKQTSRKAAAAAETATPMEIVDPDNFPRGGAAVLTPRELKTARDEAKDDALFQEANETDDATPMDMDLDEDTPKPKTPKKKAAPTPKKSDATKTKPAKAADASEDESGAIEALSFKRLVPGLVLLGAIREVGEIDLLVSLPNALTGSVRITDITEELKTTVAQITAAATDDEDFTDKLPKLASMFSVGDVVQCAVSSVEGKVDEDAGESKPASDKPVKRRVHLTLLPSAINRQLTFETILPNQIIPASVKSVEDHGYVLSIGLEGVHAFLPKGNSTAYLKARGSGALAPGSYVRCAVVSASKMSKVVTVTVDPAVLTSAVVTATPSASSLLPDMRVKARVTSVSNSGVRVSYAGFAGTIDLYHLGDTPASFAEGGAKTLEAIKELCPVGSELAARILFVNASAKTIAFTIRPGLLTHHVKPATDLHIGDIIDKTRVLTADPQLGLVLHLPVGNHIGFAHISNLSDDRIGLLGKKFASNSQHRARVIGYSLIDGLFLVSLQPSVLKLPFLRIEHIKPGSLVTGTVLDVVPAGVTVQLTDTIRGFIPGSHMSDVQLTKAPKHMSAGASVECRVLEVDTERRRVFLTHKKSLVKTSLPIVAAYTEAQPGLVTQGFITSVKPNGCVVTFFGKVHAFVPKSELSLGAADPEKFFKRNQVMKVRILELDLTGERRRLIASFKWNEESASQRVSSEAFGKDLQVGSIVSGTVTSFDETSLTVLVKDSHGETGSITIPSSQLTDHVCHEKQLLRVYAEKGFVLDRCLVLAKPAPGRIELSLKPSLLEAAASTKVLPAVSTLATGAVLPGFVKSIQPYGVFVGFLNGLTGLTHLTRLAGHFVTAPAEEFAVGQSVKAAVVEVDREDSKLTLSLNDSAVTSSSSSAFVSTFFAEQDTIIRRLCATAKPHESALAIPAARKRLSEIATSITVEGTVTQVKATGAMLDLGEGVNGWVSKEHLAGSKPAVNGKLTCAVLDVDPIANLVDLSLKPEFVSASANPFEPLQAHFAAPAPSGTSTPKSKKGAASAAAAATPASGVTIDAIVELVKPEYLILSSAAAPGSHFFASCKDFNTAVRGAPHYNVGNAVKVLLTRLPAAVSAPAATNKGKGKAAAPAASDSVDVLANLSSRRALAVVQGRSAAPAAEATNGHASAAAAATSKRASRPTMDNGFKSVDDVKLGQMVQGAVISTSAMHVNVDLGNKVHARLFITEILDHSHVEQPANKRSTPSHTAAADEVNVATIDRNNPLASFQPGMRFSARVVGFLDKHSHTYLPISHTVGGTRKLVELCMRPALLAAQSVELITIKSLTQGQLLDGYVDEVRSDKVEVSVTPFIKVRVADWEATSDLKVLQTIVFPHAKRPLSFMEDDSDLEDGADDDDDDDDEDDEDAKSDAESDENDQLQTTGLAAIYKPQQHVRVRVLRVNRHNKRVEATLRISEERSTGEHALGSIVTVKRILANDQELTVKLSDNTRGYINITNWSDDYGDQSHLRPPSSTFMQAIVVGRVVRASGDDRLELSLRPTTSTKKGRKTAAAPAAPAPTANVRDPVIRSVEDVRVGQILRGFVRHTDEKGCFVNLGVNVVGRVLISNLSDRFLLKWRTAYSTGQLVTAKVLAVDLAKKQIELSFRKEHIDPEHFVRAVSLKEIEEGQKYNAKVTGVERYGVFVKIENSDIAGLVHASEIADHQAPENFGSLFEVGDSVRVLIKQIVREKGKKAKINFSMKPSHFADEMEAEADADSLHGKLLALHANEQTAGEERPGKRRADDAPAADNAPAARTGKKARVEPEAEASSDKVTSKRKAESEADAADSGFIGLDDSSVEQPVKKSRASKKAATEEPFVLPQAPAGAADVPVLSVAAGFGFDAMYGLTTRKSTDSDDEGDAVDDGEDDENGDNSDDSDDDEEDGTSASSARRQRKAAKKREEAEIAQAEQALLTRDGAAPETVEDFERLVLASPNSSYAWIKFMAFHLSLSEVDRARQVGDQALKTISYREERERLNVWVALLNLENKFGGKDAVQQTFDRAVANCDPKAVHLQLVGIYEQTPGKKEAAEQLYKTTCTKFKDSKKVWIQYGLFKLRNGDVEGARAILQRSLKSLPKRKHIATISKFAQMEFKHGEPERGRTIFENILATYPKRLDLWSVYLDMEIRNGDVNVFEKVTNMNMSSKKMKYFLKRWLDFEKIHGNKQSADHVKLKAKSYLQSKMA